MLTTMGLLYNLLTVMTMKRILVSNYLEAGFLLS
jgi:hypothetical protein